MKMEELTEAFRKAMVDTFIPEIRQLREEIRQLREDMQTQNAQLRGEMQQLREEMKAQNAQLREEMKEIKGSLNVILHRLDVARVSKLEGQVEFLLKKAS